MKTESLPIVTAAQIRAARAFLELSQGELADRADVGRSAVADFERGARIPHDSTLRKIEAAFQSLGVELLFDGMRGVGIRIASVDRYDG